MPVLEGRAGLAAQFAFRKTSRVSKSVSAAQHCWVGAVLVLAYLYLPAQRTDGAALRRGLEQGCWLRAPQEQPGKPRTGHRLGCHLFL